jgi:cytochrome b
MPDSPTPRVYDLPTRIFHWLFGASFVAAFVIANVAEHSPAFPLHMLAGLLLAALVLFRFFWGVFGTRHARFGSFALRPRELGRYFRAMLTGGRDKWTGHNPASSWSALIMLGLAAGLAVTGVLMVNGDRETYEDVHEVLANAFLAMALLHVAGVVVHVLRHRDGFARSMIDGRKHAAGNVASVPSRPVVALLLLAGLFGVGVHLYRGYDPATQTATVFGSSLQLGEHEQGREGHDED